jgi:hypothetical protein
MSISEKFEKLSCYNKFYIPNLTKELEKAIERNDIDVIIRTTREIERFKVLCGYTPAIQQFEESLKHYGREMGILDLPEIKRALEVVPRKTCSEGCECSSEQSQRHEGLIGMLECAHDVQNNPTQEPESHAKSEFSRMLEESGKGSTEREQPHTPTPNTVTMAGMLRMVDESQFPQFCNPEKCPKDFARHCSANRPENHGKPCIYITPRNR